jgi:hypothetical protein
VSRLNPGDRVKVPGQAGGYVTVKVEQVNSRNGRPLTVHVSGEGIALRFKREAGFVIPVGQLRAV